MAREQFQTLTEPMYYILLSLMEECCGVDIMEKVETISAGRVKVGPGTLYAMLSKFEENHIIVKTAEIGRRKSYVITDLGKEMVEKEYKRRSRRIFYRRKCRRMFSSLYRRTYSHV